ncbi:MAG: hypothetical protein M1834_002862 [Cirrosporium novae-zelandiae]|nr:MAG: hypothetical protein M1834_002862 [Cirrosporium novae-zelandiae]
MPATIVHLPNGQTLTVTPVFGGMNFKNNELNLHNSSFPPGWNIVLQTEEDIDEAASDQDGTMDNGFPNGRDTEQPLLVRKSTTRRWVKPTLRNDSLFLSSISNPSSSDFKPASSPTRQIGMMLWATLWWYFHQSEPDLRLTTKASSLTPQSGRPKGEWRVYIRREGIFKGRNLLQKLERMGLISSEESFVGIDSDERCSEGWCEMFINRKSFWQLDPKIYLFTLSPNTDRSANPSGSPYPSRPNSPSRDLIAFDKQEQQQPTTTPAPPGLWSHPGSPSPYMSGSHLPTYFPPPPPQYTWTADVRHPIRPKPPRQGETFYARYVPSVNQYLSFRVASLAPRKTPSHASKYSNASSTSSHLSTLSIGSVIPPISNPVGSSTDTELLHKWMNEPRVNLAWGEAGPMSHQEAFLKAGLTNRHSFPVIGCWDGKPFGYFELYWVKEDPLARHLGGSVNDYDRGLHCLVGEQEFRGAHRVKVWLSALVHYCWLADPRTFTVMLEPRVDNEK